MWIQTKKVISYNLLQRLVFEKLVEGECLMFWLEFFYLLAFLGYSLRQLCEFKFDRSLPDLYLLKAHQRMFLKDLCFKSEEYK